MTIKSPKLLLPLSMFVLFTLLTGTAFAHKVNIFAYIEGNTVYTESYFPDGRAVEDGKITVVDSNEETLLEGRTDEKGLFSFAIPKKEDLVIILDAGMGHKNHFELKKYTFGE
jgi:nickel transport protein